ncbi:MAG: response regulator [Pseudomonadota bacterium]
MTYSLEKATVLVVEDMQPMLELTRSILTIFGFKSVFGTRDAQQGLEIVRKENPDIIITDWLMEPMSGIEFIKQIRTSENSPNPYVPIILMTGYSDKTRVEAARDSGVTEFLMKPYTAKDLYSRIVQIIEKPRQFVDCGTFFGPDRRRRKNFDYQGPMRRTVDNPESEEDIEEKRKVASQILNDLREQTDKI